MQSIITFVQGHEAMVAGIGVAVIDFLFAINPNLKANSILQQVLAFFTKAQS